MSEPARWTGQMPPTQQRQGQMPASSNDGTNLADILERVLDKGIVIAGDIQINLLDIELLTIKLRLVVASVDKAKEMGIDWWERDPTLSSGHRELEDENQRLRKRLEALEGASPRAVEGEDVDATDSVEGEDVDEADSVDGDDSAESEDSEEPEPVPARPRRTARSSTGTARSSGGSARAGARKRS